MDYRLLEAHPYNFSRKRKRRQRQLLSSSLGALDATSEVPFPLWETEARQHKRKKDVASNVCLCCCCPWADADFQVCPSKQIYVSQLLGFGHQAQPFHADNFGIFGSSEKG